MGLTDIRDSIINRLEKTGFITAGTQRKKAPRFIKIQSMVPEGGKENIIIESLLTANRLGISIPGTTNAYQNYGAQVSETYRKYNGQADFGNQQTRVVIDLRTAFIAGEGVSISTENEQTADWIEQFLERNYFNGNKFINAVKGSEMTGQSLLLIKPQLWKDESVYIKISRLPYVISKEYRPVYLDDTIRDEVVAIQIKKEGNWVTSGFSDFVYIRTGGDDTNSYDAVTKVGVVLTDIENYDRAIKDMRRNNHIFARITPTWETETEAEAKTIRDQVNQQKWKIGDAFMGAAKFKYETPGSGAHENLAAELVATIKNISSITGIPVHWLGYVDLMSNRSTAETLYEAIKNATINERSEWQTGMYNLILKAQEMYIDSGGTDLPKLDYDFIVKLPLISFSDFFDRIKAYSQAFADRAISIDDYRNAIPGINPMKTKKAVELEEKEAEEKLVRVGLDLQTLNQEENEDGESDESSSGE